jgi:hypothetical protein
MIALRHDLHVGLTNIILWPNNSFLKSVTIMITKLAKRVSVPS